MKVSVFTPFYHVGNPYIAETYRSLVAQTHTDWEWVILYNGEGCKLPREILNDPRVRVVKAQHTSGLVGALKREACGHCKGEILFELDHDDLLREDALAYVSNWIYQGYDFVYSDFAEFKDGSWEPNMYGNVGNGYGASFGWLWYGVQFQGHNLMAAHAPPVTAQNIRRVTWAPNHLRAWRASFYWQLYGNSYDAGEAPFVGGHNASLKFADDHDLVVRTFLCGGKIAHIPECLYFYRVHANQNTNAKVGNDLIQQLDAKVYDRYIYKLAEKFADDTPGPHMTIPGQRSPRLARIDLCGAHDCPDGYTSIDMVEGRPGSLVADLNKRWPLEDNSVGVIRAHDAIEHLRCQMHTMNEAYRVLAPGGFLLTMTPSTSGPGAWCDPTHVSFWNQKSFRYYTDRNYAKYIPEYKGRFQLSDLSESGGEIPYVRAGLIALKHGYEPMGEVLI